MRRHRRTTFSTVVLVVLAAFAAACGAEASPSLGSVVEPSHRAPAPDSTERDPTSTSRLGTTVPPVPSPPAAAEPVTAPVATTSNPAPPPTTPIERLAPNGLPAPAADPIGLAAQIVEAERLTRDDATDTAVVIEQARLLQVAYRRLSERPDWDAEVAAAVGSELAPVVAAHTLARREFLAMTTRLQDDVPAWRVVAPRPSDELLELYRAVEAEHAIPWEILAAINLVETGFGRIDGLSTAGAVGPMQFLPATWARFGAGGDPRDPSDAIPAAGRFLSFYGAPDDIDGALWRYNNSDRYVRAVRWYASLMADDPAAFRGLYHWEIIFRTTAGEVWLPVGYEQAESIPAVSFLAEEPAARAN